MLVDIGPHPNPAKAADGKRLHALAPDPNTAHVVRRIFAEYLAGRGLKAIAEGLTRDDPGRCLRPRADRHRCGIAWAYGAVRAILSNPRYRAGRCGTSSPSPRTAQRQRRRARPRHQAEVEWPAVDWSKEPVHEPLIGTEAFEQVQALSAQGFSR